MNKKTVVVGITGSIAAYKACYLIRALKEKGYDVRVVMTKNAKEFIGEATLRGLSGSEVLSEMFDKDVEWKIGHISLAQEADAVLVAPATANIIGKFANGIADDFLSTFLISVKKPVIICPAMDEDMLENPSVRRNMEKLKSSGVAFVEPEKGMLASGRIGRGRLADTDKIIEKMEDTIGAGKDFMGKRFLVTAGPTREYIDRVRFVTNPSTGKMGFAIAREAAERGGEVVLICGKTPVAPPPEVKTVETVSAREMADEVFKRQKRSDIIVMTAAVSDYAPEKTHKGKIKKTKNRISVRMIKTVDILKKLGAYKGKKLLVGFSIETGSLIRNSLKKLKEKNLDMIVANRVGRDSGFESDTNIATIITRDGKIEKLGKMTKKDLAGIILDRIRDMMPSEIPNRK